MSREGRSGSGGAQALSRNLRGLLPDGLFARMLAIVIACVAIPEIIALAIAPEAHRSAVLGSFCAGGRECGILWRNVAPCGARASGSRLNGTRGRV